MRPVGEVRVAVVQAATALIEERRALGAGCGPHGVTAHLVAPRAQVQFDVARQALRRAADAGELLVLRTAHVSGVCRPVLVYGLPPACSDGAVADAAAAGERAEQRSARADDAAALLSAAIGGWARFE